MQQITPFWEIIPQVFRYPAKTDALLTIGLFAFLWLLTGIPGLVGLILAIVLVAATYRYAYSVLVHTARGNMEPPPSYFSNVSENIFWQQLGLWILLFAVVFATAWLLGFLIAMIVLLVILVALPMATIILAIDQSITQALNPAVWFDGIGRIGLPYAALVLFLVLLMLTSGFLTNTVAPLFPFGIGYLIANFISMYFLVAMFFLMGYVIYQYHEEFGWELAPQGALPRGPRANPLLEQAEEKIEAGDIEGAKRVLAATAAEAGPLSDVGERYVKLLRVSRDGAALTAYAKKNLEGLLELGEEQKALDLILECNALDPDFKFRDGRHVLTFMELAARYGRHKDVVDLAKGFTKRYPKHADTGEVLYLTAHTLTHNLGRDEAAWRIVRQLHKAFPNHPRRQEIEQLYGLLKPV